MKSAIPNLLTVGKKIVQAMAIGKYMKKSNLCWTPFKFYGTSKAYIGAAILTRSYSNSKQYKDSVLVW